MNPGIQFSKSKVDMKTVLLPRRTKPASESTEKPAADSQEKNAAPESEAKPEPDSQQSS